MTSSFWRYCVLLLMGVVVLSVAYPSAQRRSPAIFASGYGYQIMRPDACRSERDYAKCYLCGKVADDRRIYDFCCRGNRNVLRFCDSLLSWEPPASLVRSVVQREHHFWRRFRGKWRYRAARQTISSSVLIGRIWLRFVNTASYCVPIFYNPYVKHCRSSPSVVCTLNTDFFTRSSDIHPRAISELFRYDQKNIYSCVYVDTRDLFLILI